MQKLGPAEGAQGVSRWIIAAADIAAVTLGAFTVVVALGAGGRFTVAGVRISVTSPVNLAIELAILLLVRHAFVRHPSTWANVQSVVARPGVFRVLSASAAGHVVIPAFLLTRIGVVLTGYLAVLLIGYAPDSPPHRISSNEFWNLPDRWDVGWYTGVAAHGYAFDPQNPGQQNIAFFPAYPFAIRVAAAVADPIHAAEPSPVLLPWAGVAVSWAAFLAALLYLSRLAADQFGEQARRQTVFLLTAYPFAMFYGTAYSESLFLLSSVGAFYHFEERQFRPAAAWGLLAGLIRPNGCLLAVPLAILATAAQLHRAGAQEPRRTPDERPWEVLAVVGPMGGMLLYSLFVFWLTGDAFAWVWVQQAWNRGFRIPDEQTWSAFTEPTAFFDAAALVFVVAALVPVTRMMGGAYGTFVAINTLAPFLNGGVPSMGRYSAVLFPIFLWLGARLPERFQTPLVALFAMGQAFAATLFFTWRPLF